MKRCACIAVAALALAACGGNGDARLSKAAYEATLRSAFTTAYADLGQAPHAAGSVSLLKRIATSYGDVASALKVVHPPAEVQQLNDRLVTAASSRATELNRLATRLTGASRTKRQRLLAEYDASHVGGQDGFDRAVAALTAKGYRFRPSAGT